MADPENSALWQRVARAIIPLPQRTILAVMIFLGTVVAYGMRNCLSVTIIAIVEPKHKSSKNTTNLDQCPFPPNYDTGGSDQDPIYNWDEALIGYILSSFYIGYLISHVPGGILADIFGGKIVLSSCVISTTFLTLITPVCLVQGGPYVLIVIRILIGLVQGALFPALNVLLASWIPADERAFYGAFVYSSSQIGTVYGTIVPGVLLKHYRSWTLVYYVFGLIGLVWCLLFVLMCSSKPSNHLYISDTEKKMLQEKIPVIQRTRFQDAPWLDILKNVPVIILVIAECGHDFGFFIMVTDLPKYLSDVLHYDINTNGFLSSLPFISMFIVSIITGYLADYIIHHNKMSLVNCRKLFTTLGAFLPSVGMILASYAGCAREWVVVFFIIGMATMGFFYSGMRVNALDLSPRFAGLVMALVNGLGSLMGVIGPSLVGLLTVHSTVYEFRIVFWIAFALLNGTCILYLLWASGDVQPFNDKQPDSNSE